MLSRVEVSDGEALNVGCGALQDERRIKSNPSGTFVISHLAHESLRYPALETIQLSG
jgi:hypothetical protein